MKPFCLFQIHVSSLDVSFSALLRCRNDILAGHGHIKYHDPENKELHYYLCIKLHTGEFPVSIPPSIYFLAEAGQLLARTVSEAV